MKKFVKILLVIAAIIAVALAAVFYFTSDMVTVADNFFKAVKAGDIEKAYSYVSDDFKAGTSKDALKEYLSKNGLAAFKDASWGERSISGSRGELTGAVSTESGGVVSIKLSFVKGDSGWKIYYIDKPSAGIHEKTTSQQIPPEAELVKLVSVTTNTFAVAVNEKSMARLHGFCSALMQKQFSIEKLDKLFGEFYKLGSDLTMLDNYSPAFDEKPAINEDGLLVIKGHYPTKPSQVFFQYKYIFEGLGWKLLAIRINIE